MSSEPRELAADQQRIDELTTRLKAQNDRKERFNVGLAATIDAARLEQEELEEKLERRHAEIAPAEKIVWRVLQALPWEEPLPLGVSQYPGVDAFADGGNVTLKIDHEEVRRRLHDRSEPVAFCWRKFVSVAAEGVLEDYANGQVDLAGAIKAIGGCSRACAPSYEPSAIVRVSTIAPRSLNASRPPFPSWVKCVAVTLARVLIEAHHPGRRLPIDQWTNTSPILNAVTDWLDTLGVRGYGTKQRPSPSTIRRWYLEDLRNRGASRGPGRPSLGEAFEKL